MDDKTERSILRWLAGRLADSDIALAVIWFRLPTTNRMDELQTVMLTAVFISWSEKARENVKRIRVLFEKYEIKTGNWSSFGITDPIKSIYMGLDVFSLKYANLKYRRILWYEIYH